MHFNFNFNLPKTFDVYSKIEKSSPSFFNQLLHHPPIFNHRFPPSSFTFSGLVEVKKVVKLSWLRREGEAYDPGLSRGMARGGNKKGNKPPRTMAPRESDPPRMIFALPFRDMAVDTRNPI